MSAQTITRFLSCPVCGRELAPEGATVRCIEGHSFDVARHGYVNLLSGKRPRRQGDDGPMVEARSRFLHAGRYAPLSNLLAELAAEQVRERPGSLLLDVGAGPGYYLAEVLERCPGSVGIALDLSVHAARRAAKAHPRMGALVADAEHLIPVRTASAAVVMSAFAPRFAAELRRVIAPDGTLLIATPAADHLREIVGPLGLLHVDEGKEERLAQRLAPMFEKLETHRLSFTMSLGQADIVDLVWMGPSARHLETGALREKVVALGEPVEVTASFEVRAFRPR